MADEPKALMHVQVLAILMLTLRRIPALHPFLLFRPGLSGTCKTRVAVTSAAYDFETLVHVQMCALLVPALRCRCYCRHLARIGTGREIIAAISTIIIVIVNMRGGACGSGCSLMAIAEEKAVAVRFVGNNGWC